MAETHTTNSTSAVTTDDERVKASIDNWKRKLLDLTKRNRALNFKVNKVSTVTIVDEQPAQVFRQLYLDENSMRFKAAPESDQADNETTSQSAVISPPDRQQLFPTIASGAVGEELSLGAFEEEDEDDGLHSDFVPYDAASLEERHTDDQLQTSSQAEALDKSLRRIEEQARLSIDEQGVNPLFLALGMLHYTESV